MKKDRNCGGTPYPVYPNMYNGIAGPLPVSGVNMPMPMPIGVPTYETMPTAYNANYSSSDLNSLNSRLTSLEQRVTNLENSLNNYSSNYNSSNYQVM